MILDIRNILKRRQSRSLEACKNPTKIQRKRNFLDSRHSQAFVKTAWPIFGSPQKSKIQEYPSEPKENENNSVSYDMMCGYYHMKHTNCINCSKEIPTTCFSRCYLYIHKLQTQNPGTSPRPAFAIAEGAGGRGACAIEYFLVRVLPRLLQNERNARSDP